MNYIILLNEMKKLFFGLLSLFAGAMLFVSCDGAENGVHYTGFYMMNVFDIKKSYIYPSFSDTAYFVEDIALGDGQTTLADGDRAYMSIDIDYDPYTMKYPKQKIGYVISKITRRELSEKGGFVVTKYNSPFKRMAELVSFMDHSGVVHDSDFLWADATTQNIIMCFKKGWICSPRMVVDSLRKGDLGAVLYFRLYADIAERKGWVDNEVITNDNIDLSAKIFSYNMDWEKIKSELTAEEQAMLSSIDSLTSHISVVVEGAKKDADGMYIPEGYFTNDKFANPYYKK